MRSSYNSVQRFVETATVLLLLLLLSLASSSSTVAAAKAKLATRSLERALHLTNASEKEIQLYWIHPETKAASLMSSPTIRAGADFSINTFVAHEFQVREMPDAATGSCAGGGGAAPETCRTVLFQITKNDDQIVTVTKDFTLDVVDSQIKAQKAASGLLKDCQATAKRRLAAAGVDKSAGQVVMDDLLQCVEDGVAAALERVHEEIAFQAAVRMDVAGLLENYTCADDTLQSTKDLQVRQWYQTPDSPTPRTVHVKHERAASRIHMIEQFIQPDECEAMALSAEQSLHHATVADGQGGSRLSENRKAMQAGIKVPWSQEQEDNPIARLSRRVYDYANYVLELDIAEHGQEDLMSIQYFGRGHNDTEPDRYTPHCDGDCTGMAFKAGTRMATMVMYCTVPESGGHTNFRNAGVHIKPAAGDALFFSYIDPLENIMDTGFTEHSGCPVYEGEKKIVTQWIRFGVDDDNPWDSFNTLGIKIAPAVDDANDDADVAPAVDDANDDADVEADQDGDNDGEGE